MGSFCDSPMNGSEFYKEDAPKSGSKSNTYNGEDVTPFSEYKRTPSPNAVPEVTYDKGISGGKPTGEPDQF